MSLNIKVLQVLTNEQFIKIGKLVDSSYRWYYNDHFDDEEFYAINGQKNGDLIMLKIFYNENPQLQRLVILDGQDFTEKTLGDDYLIKIQAYLNEFLNVAKDNLISKIDKDANGMVDDINEF